MKLTQLPYWRYTCANGKIGLATMLLLIAYKHSKRKKMAHERIQIVTQLRSHHEPW